MPSYCCVPQCNSRGGHLFPIEHSMKRKWLEAIRREDSWKPTRYTVVCCKHFTSDNYKCAGLLNERRCLKPDAVPSIFSWIPTNEMSESAVVNQFIDIGEMANPDEFAHRHKLVEPDLACDDDDKLLTHSNLPVYTSKHTDHTYARLWPQETIDNKNEQVTVKLEKSEDLEYFNGITDLGQYSDGDMKPTIADSEYDDPEQSTVLVNLIEIVPQVQSSGSISDTDDKKQRTWFNESTTFHQTPPEQSVISLNSLNGMLHKHSSVACLNRLSVGHQNEANDVNSQSSAVLYANSTLMYPVVHVIKNQCNICKTSFDSNCSFTYPVHVCRNDPLTRIDRAIIGSSDHVTNNKLITTKRTITSHCHSVWRKEFFRQENLWKCTTRHEKNEARALPRGFDPSNSSHSIGHAETVSRTSKKSLACTICSSQCRGSSKLPTHTTRHSHARPFSCAFCSFRFKHMGSLSEHVLRHHSDETPLTCTLCPFRCWMSHKLTRHMRSHGDEKPFACTMCSYRCSEILRLFAHLRRHASEEKFFCTDCSYKCKQRSNLTAHMRRHIGENRFACSQCSYQCSYRYQLSNHLRRHTGEKPFACLLCAYRCSQSDRLRAHMRTHTGEKEFACDRCSFRCSKKIYLTKHVNGHAGEKQFSRTGEKRFQFSRTGEKRFRCTICPYRSRIKINLTKHTLIHTGEKPFACALCPYRSSQKSHLSVHMRRHSDEKPFACELCPNRYKGKSGLRMHMLSHTGVKPFGCALCPYRCSQRCSLSVHMRRHSADKTFACELCPKRYKGKNALLMHMLSHILV